MRSKVWSGVLFVCGTSIGTGILGIPAVTAEVGFANSLLVLAICWVFSTISALYFLEAHCWQEDMGSNILSMTQHFFGKTAKGVVWVIYLALLYSLMCTYLLAGSSWLSEASVKLFQIHLPLLPAIVLFIGLIGLFIGFGIRVVDHVNRWMSLGFAASLVAILALTLPHVSTGVLLDKPNQWQFMPGALPLLITAFGYSIIVPSLNQYFQKHVVALQRSIAIGSLVTFMTYVLWELATLGNIPMAGTHGLYDIAHSQDNGTEVASALVYFTQHAYLSAVILVFAVFAVITSFLGVSMALHHALIDGVNIRSRRLLNVVSLILTYLPPAIFVMLIPTGFSEILSWAGSLVAILLGILPIAMVWKGRYSQQLGGYRVWGGKPLLVLTLIFFIGVVVAELTR
jgi:tyrosine-specific transport protein